MEAPAAGSVSLLSWAYISRPRPICRRLLDNMERVAAFRAWVNSSFGRRNSGVTTLRLP